MRTKWMLAGLGLSCVFSAHAAVTIDQMAVQQIPGEKTVRIEYDVGSDLTNQVSVILRVLDATTELSVSSVSGDIGSAVETGAGKVILWDSGADWDGGAAENLEFWLIGTDTSISPVQAAVVVAPGTLSGTDPDYGAFALALETGLYVDAGEVTKESWDAVYNWALSNGYDFLNSGLAISNNHPVTTVSWYDCVKWCNARSEMEGVVPCYQSNGSVYRSGQLIPVLNTEADGYRLPTSDEWEYIARAGTASRYPFGNSISHEDANYYSAAGLGYDVSVSRGYHPDTGDNWPATLPVASFSPNAYGLFDTVGSVWEWCWDADETYRIFRGGSWMHGADQARSGNTFSDLPENSWTYVGFRTVRSAGGGAGAAVAAVDARDYTLEVISQAGSPVPAVGVHTYAWGSSVACTVAAESVEGGSVYLNRGWRGTGSISSLGSTTTTGMIALTNLNSSIEWRWLADNDYDDLPNEWELTYYGSVTGAVASADTDGDGYSSADELYLGTDPTDPQSHLNLMINSASSVSCFTASGRTYFLEYKDALDASGWTALGQYEGTGEIEQYNVGDSTDERFFRVKVELQPGVDL